MAKKQGRNIMAGRHAVGQQTARPGGIRGGQGEPAGNKGGGITGSRPAMRPQAPVLSNQAETSRTAQRMIPRPPMPFENPRGSVNVPAPTHRSFRSTGSPKELNYQKTNVGCANTSLSPDEMAAIGYAPKDTRSSNPIISGFPTGSKRQAGMPGTNTNRKTSGRENARMRQRPGGF